MRIGLIGSTFPPIIGGMEVYLWHLAQNLVGFGHCVQVGTRFTQERPNSMAGLLQESEQGRDYVENDVRVHILNPGRRRVLLRPVNRLRFRKQTRSLAKSLVWHSFSSSLLDIFGGSDILHYSGTGSEMLGFAVARLARIKGIRLVITPHTHADAWGDGELDFELYRMADQMIALTSDERRRLIDGGLQPDQVSIVKHAVSRTSKGSGERFRCKHGIAGPMIFFLGRKTTAKGYKLILEAAPLVWADFPEAKFVLAGPADSAEKFQIDTLQDPRVLDLDYLTDEERDDAYAACDVVCVPSAHEAFGFVYVEAWAFSKPVVALRIPTLIEIVEGAQGGLLTDHTPVAVADALCTLLADPGLRNELGKAGYNTASRRTGEAVARDTLEVYRQAMEETS